MKKIVVLGAGISGLSVGFKLSRRFDVEILEKENVIGGLCASFKYKDFILDYGPHKLYSQIPSIMDEFDRILGEECLKVKKRNSLRLMGKYFEFPIKFTQLVKNISPKTFMSGVGIGVDYGFALFGRILKKKNITYEDYFINGFGKKGYNVLFRDLAWKVWGNPKLLTEELGRRRVPVPSVLGIIQSMLLKREEKKVSAEYFYYPRKGIGVVCGNLKKKIEEKKGNIYLNSKPLSVDIQDNKVRSLTYSKDGKKITSETDFLISTIPVTELPFLINPLPPKDVLGAAKNLKYRALIVVYLIIDTPKIMDDIWIFFLDKEVIFNRVSEQKRFSKFTVPEDKTALMVELTAEVGDKVWNYSSKELVEIVIRDLKKIGLLKDEKIEDSFIKKIKDVYPVLSVDYKEKLKKILDYIDTIPNLYTIGRYGMFNYNNMDHCIDMSYKTAEHIISNRSKEDWKQKRKIFESYRIVD